MKKSGNYFLQIDANRLSDFVTVIFFVCHLTDNALSIGSLAIFRIGFRKNCFATTTQRFPLVARQR